MNFIYLNFSNSNFKIDSIQSEFSWQKEIIDFIKYYQECQEIKVKTSGSTGKPKEFFLPKIAMQKSAELTGKFLILKNGDTALLCLPVEYIAGKMMIVRALEMELNLFCIEPKSLINWNEKPIDFVAMTPMQAENSIENLDKFKKIILGGAKVSLDLENKLKSVNSEIYETYGMTETITHIAMRKLNVEKDFHVLPEMKIRQDARDCLVIKTPYFDDEIVTNDLVEIVNENQFKLIGRIDNIINSGGIKINPEELEDKLKPFIPQPFIIHSKPDKKLGEKVVLIIESEEKFELKIPDNLIPKNQQPKEIIFIKSFPRTEIGKIKRMEIVV